MCSSLTVPDKKMLALNTFMISPRRYATRRLTTSGFPRTTYVLLNGGVKFGLHLFCSKFRTEDMENSIYPKSMDCRFNTAYTSSLFQCADWAFNANNIVHFG